MSGKYYSNYNMKSSEDLLEYIKKARSQKISDSEITTNLLQAGWSNEDIRQALANTSVSDSSQLPLLEIPKKTAHYGMWIAFEHILLFISLYVMATSLALTLHVFVDKWFPGIPVDGYSSRNFWGNSQSTLLRGYLASLIVSTPMFSGFFLHITKRTKQDPNIRALRARKTLIYLTLVGTFLFLMYSIIKIVFTLLSGNITFNFVLHFLVTSGVSGVIFAYYLNEVKGDRKNA